MEEKKDKRVVFLTIIAILTMVVVVVGTTFAYLLNNVSANENVQMTVQTSGGTDLFTIDAGTDYEISANEENFSDEDDNIIDVQYSTATLHTDKETGASVEYTISLEPSVNEFTYTSGVCYSNVGASVTGAATEDACTGTNVWATNGTVSACYASASNQDTTKNYAASCTTAGKYWVVDKTQPELTFALYKDNGKDVATCTGTNETFADGKCYAPVDTEFTFDITELQESKVLYTTTISVDAAGTKVDSYKGVLTLINKPFNQSAIADKNFAASLRFATVDEP